MIHPSALLQAATRFSSTRGAPVNPQVAKSELPRSQRRGVIEAGRNFDPSNPPPQKKKYIYIYRLYIY